MLREVPAEGEGGAGRFTRRPERRVRPVQPACDHHGQRRPYPRAQEGEEGEEEIRVFHARMPHRPRLQPDGAKQLQRLEQIRVRHPAAAGSRRLAVHAEAVD